MPDLTAKRTLVKSPPELWEELSEVEGLAKHLGAFGEIKITKLEPEHTVAWEGEGASGTVSIEPSGWGTKVTLTAQVEEEPEVEAESEVEATVDAEPLPEPAPEPEPEPEPIAEPIAEEPSPPTRPGFFARFFRRTRAPEEAGGPEHGVEAEHGVEPEPQGAPEPAPEPPTPDPEPDPAPAVAHAQAVLEDALEALGSAHHRPFSRG
jgi:hypothetical protein